MSDLFITDRAGEPSDDRSPARRAPAAATVEVVVPVYNEEATLAQSVERLRRYLDERFPFPAQVTVADNASTDGTWQIAQGLERRLAGVRTVHLDAKGRGRALRAVWSESPAPVVAYMDVDLSTGLDALLPLVAPLLSGHSDVAIGSRLARGARVARGARREVISRSYNLLLRAGLRSRFSDAQCGFKALRSEAARALLPLVADNAWFFDTELLVVAEANGLRVHEVPVDWVDDPDSRVDVAATAAADLRGMARMWWRLATGTARLHGRGPQAAAASGVAWVGLLAAGAVLAAVAPPAGLLVAGLAAAAALLALALARATGSVGRRDLALRRHARSVPTPRLVALDGGAAARTPGREQRAGRSLDVVGLALAPAPVAPGVPAAAVPAS